MTAENLLIIAFDGLEATLVEKWNLTNLLQTFHGTYPVESEKYATPALWSAFITGLHPSSFEAKFVERNVPGVLRRLAFLEIIKKLGRLVFKPHPFSVKDRYETIFEKVQPSLPYNVFSYNEEPTQFKLRLKYSIPETIGNRNKCLEACREWMRLATELAEKFVHLLKSVDWKIAMTHFYFTDIIGHLHPPMMRKAYLKADRIARLLRSSVDSETMILIVSDHGMRRGIHTEYGFYSSNIVLDTKPADITDFYSLILKWTRERHV